MRKLGMLIAGVSFILSFALCTNALAENRAGAITISPYIGGCLFEGDQHLKTSMVYGGALGYDITDNWGMELSSAFIDSGTRHGDSVDVDTYFYHLDGLYHFTYLGKFQPFLAAGVGGMTFNYRTNGHGKDPSGTAFALNYGGGFEYFIVDNFALRGDLRHVITTDGGHNDLMGTVGFTVLFGGRQAQASEPAAVPPPPPVEKAEAPAPPPPPAPKKQENVCIDLKVEFDFDKDDIKPEYHDDIQRVADFLKANPTFHGTIEGGTDAVGSEDYNLGLSLRRADSVKKYLVDNFGIDSARLKTVGYGKVKPIATNLTAEGRQINRRAVRVYCSSGEDAPPPPLAQKCIVLKVDFAVGSSKVDPEKYADAFKEIADYMKAHPDFVGTVEGYADASGTAQLNMDLTMKRAENVKKVLVEKYGVPANRLRAEGYGKERPINSNETVEGQGREPLRRPDDLRARLKSNMEIRDETMRAGVSRPSLTTGSWYRILLDSIFCATSTTIKGGRAVKTIYSVALMVATAAMLTFSVPVSAFSQMKDMSMNEHREGHGQMMEMGDMDKMGDMMGMCIEHADKMGLTDDQLAKMKPIHRDMQKKQAQFRADIKIAGIDLMEIMEVKDFDLEKASAEVKKIADIKTAHHLEMLKDMKEMRTMLTDEQFKKMQKMMSMKMGEKKPAKRMMKKQ